MIKYKVIGVASGGNKNDLRGERIYLGNGLYNSGKSARSTIEDSGTGNHILIGQCSSGHERNAVRVVNIYDKACCEDMSGKRVVTRISDELPRSDPFPYAVIDVDGSGVCALASGGSLIYEFYGEKLKLLSFGGRLSRTKSDNFLAFPKIFIGFSRSIVDVESSSVIEMYLTSGEDFKTSLQRVVSRADILNPNARKSAVAIIAIEDLSPIYEDESNTPQIKAKKDYNRKSRSVGSLLLKITIWSVIVIVAVVLICLGIGIKYGGT